MLKLSERTYNCDSCGLQLDRDLNAAINLRQYTASYAGSACGAAKHRTDLSERAATDSSARKQEANSDLGHQVQICVSLA